MSRRVLLVSPYFPPSTLAGVHRARHLAKHLPAFGWVPTVLAVDDDQYTETPDPDLMKLVPRDLDIERCGAIPAKPARLAGIGDIGLRAYIQLKSTIARLVEQKRPEVIVITGFPFYPMLLAPWIKKRFGVPVVLDFQDPWVSAWGATRPFLSKARLAHELAVRLEPRAVAAASYITSVSDTQNAEMAARYPGLDANQMAGIPIGGDPEDFDALRGEKIPPQLGTGAFNLSYVGTCLPRSIPLLETFFAAVAAMRERAPEVTDRLRLNFVGTSNQPGVTEDYQVRPIAARYGITDLVHEFPARVPFLEALRILAQSDALLLIGSDEPHYTASKIYPALQSGRPFLSLFHQQSSAHDILTRAGGGVSFAFGDRAALEALTPEITGALEAILQGTEQTTPRNDAVIEPYTARAVAGRFAAIFDQLAGGG